MTAFADFDALRVGDSRRLIRAITENDIRRFVEMTGDDNPLHVDREFAATTAFKDVVVHGMLGASFISTVIGTQLPGPGALWVSQSLEFLLPVRLGDTLTVTCTIVAKHERERLLEMEMRIFKQDKQLVLQGRGKVRLLEPRAGARKEDPSPAPRRVAVVTGGAGGIGEAICRRLAREGFKLVLNYQHKQERAERIVREIREAKGDAIAVRADVSDPDGVSALLQEALARFGSVDVLVNNASPGIHPKRLEDTTWDDIGRHLDVQVKSAFLAAQQCAPEMRRRGFGRIVNIGSQVTQGVPTTHWTAYAVAKAALVMLSRSLAAELAPSGVTVNCVAPGMTDTPLIGDIPEKQQLIVARQTPLRRLASPHDIAAAVAYLASDDAAFVTGHTLAVNGGMVMS